MKNINSCSNKKPVLKASILKPIQVTTPMVYIPKATLYKVVFLIKKGT